MTTTHYHVIEATQKRTGAMTTFYATTKNLKRGTESFGMDWSLKFKGVRTSKPAGAINVTERF